ncbi:MAG: hypothetical protein ABL923_07155 [Burkholderiaceae bacterium]
MKYEKLIHKISAGELSRADLHNLRLNAFNKLTNGDDDAKAVLSAIGVATPRDTYILFMGFCPDADINNRQDTEWKKDGVCRFDYLESEIQVERFNRICIGDLVILKKREQFGKTMKLYGHGRVIGIGHESDEIQFLKMNWSSQSLIIEVPLMGCNSTVDIKEMETIKAEMSDEFYSWLSDEKENDNGI